MNYTVDLSVENNGRYYATLTKEFTSDYPISEGTLIFNSAWKAGNEKKVIEAVYDIDSESVSLRIDFKVECPDKTQCDDEIEMYKNHGWDKL